ncbi:MAG: hypothetical protein AB9888_12915 [Bacteroidales bacterium]
MVDVANFLQRVDDLRRQQVNHLQKCPSLNMVKKLRKDAQQLMAQPNQGENYLDQLDDVLRQLIEGYARVIQKQAHQVLESPPTDSQGQVDFRPAKKCINGFIHAIDPDQAKELLSLLIKAESYVEAKRNRDGIRDLFESRSLEIRQRLGGGENENSRMGDLPDDTRQLSAEITKQVADFQSTHPDWPEITHELYQIKQRAEDLYTEINNKIYQPTSLFHAKEYLATYNNFREVQKGPARDRELVLYYESEEACNQGTQRTVPVSTAISVLLQIWGSWLQKNLKDHLSRIDEFLNEEETDILAAERELQEQQENKLYELPEETLHQNALFPPPLKKRLGDTRDRINKIKPDYRSLLDEIDACKGPEPVEAWEKLNAIRQNPQYRRFLKHCSPWIEATHKNQAELLQTMWQRVDDVLSEIYASPDSRFLVAQEELDSFAEDLGRIGPEFEPLRQAESLLGCLIPELEKRLNDARQAVEKRNFEPAEHFLTEVDQKVTECETELSGLRESETPSQTNAFAESSEREILRRLAEGCKNIQASIERLRAKALSAKSYEVLETCLSELKDLEKIKPEIHFDQDLENLSHLISGLKDYFEAKLRFNAGSAEEAEVLLCSAREFIQRLPEKDDQRNPKLGLIQESLGQIQKDILPSNQILQAALKEIDQTVDPHLPEQDYWKGFSIGNEKIRILRKPIRKVLSGGEECKLSDLPATQALKNQLLEAINLCRGQVVEESTQIIEEAIRSNQGQIDILEEHDQRLRQCDLDRAQELQAPLYLLIYRLKVEKLLQAQVVNWVAVERACGLLARHAEAMPEVENSVKEQFGYWEKAAQKQGLLESQAPPSFRIARLEAAKDQFEADPDLLLKHVEVLLQQSLSLGAEGNYQNAFKICKTAETQLSDCRNALQTWLRENRVPPYERQRLTWLAQDLQPALTALGHELEIIQAQVRQHILLARFRKEINAVFLSKIIRPEDGAGHLVVNLPPLELLQAIIRAIGEAEDAQRVLQDPLKSRFDTWWQEISSDTARDLRGIYNNFACAAEERMYTAICALLLAPDDQNASLVVTQLLVQFMADFTRETSAAQEMVFINGQEYIAQGVHESIIIYRQLEKITRLRGQIFVFIQALQLLNQRHSNIPELENNLDGLNTAYQQISFYWASFTRFWEEIKQKERLFPYVYCQNITFQNNTWDTPNGDWHRIQTFQAYPRENDLQGDVFGTHVTRNWWNSKITTPLLEHRKNLQNVYDCILLLLQYQQEVVDNAPAILEGKEWSPSAGLRGRVTTVEASLNGLVWLEVEQKQALNGVCAAVQAQIVESPQGVAYLKLLQALVNRYAEMTVPNGADYDYELPEEPPPNNKRRSLVMGAKESLLSQMYQSSEWQGLNNLQPESLLQNQIKEFNQLKASISPWLDQYYGQKTWWVVVCAMRKNELDAANDALDAQLPLVAASEEKNLKANIDRLQVFVDDKNHRNNLDEILLIKRVQKDLDRLKGEERQLNILKAQITLLPEQFKTAWDAYETAHNTYIKKQNRKRWFFQPKNDAEYQSAGEKISRCFEIAPDRKDVISAYCFYHPGVQKPLLSADEWCNKNQVMVWGVQEGGGHVSDR